MPDTLMIPAHRPSVSSALADLIAVRTVLNANEDPAQEDPLGKAHGEVQARFVAEPVRSLADAITKLEFVVGEDELDSIDENIINGVIEYLRAIAGTSGQVQ